jgi:AraC-like DNA-binding protein
MRQAAEQLRVNDLSINQIAQNAGYASRSSFVRAFRSTYEMEPNDFRPASPKSFVGTQHESRDVQKD